MKKLQERTLKQHTDKDQSVLVNKSLNLSESEAIGSALFELCNIFAEAESKSVQP